MTRPSPARRLDTRVLAAGVAVLVLAGVVLWVALSRGGSNATPKTRVANTGFTFKYPPTWEPISAAELKTVNPPALSVVRRKDGKGVVVLRRRVAKLGNAKALARDLDIQFRKKFGAGYQPLTARMVQLPAGRAFFFSYLRTKRGPLDTLVIVPSGGASFVFNTIAPAGKTTITAEIGSILKSFRPTSAK